MPLSITSSSVIDQPPQPPGTGSTSATAPDDDLSLDDLYDPEVRKGPLVAKQPKDWAQRADGSWHHMRAWQIAARDAALSVGNAAFEALLTTDKGYSIDLGTPFQAEPYGMP